MLKSKGRGGRKRSDAALRGDGHNAAHELKRATLGTRVTGTELTDQERFAILESIKTLTGHLARNRRPHKRSPGSHPFLDFGGLDAFDRLDTVLHTIR